MTPASLSLEQISAADVLDLMGSEVAECATKGGSCTVGEYDRRLTISFEKAEDGGFHLSSLESYSNTSCGC